MKKFLLPLAALLLLLFASSSRASPVLYTGNGSGVANGVEVLGATTGNTPVVSSQGTDTNVGLILNTQGNGSLTLETAANGDVILAPAAGNVTIPAFTTSGIVLNNASGVLSTGTALPNGTTATTQSANDNSTKVATTAYVDSAVSGATVTPYTNHVLLTSGTTWTVPAGVTQVYVCLQGGGASGGYQNFAAGSASAGTAGEFKCALYSVSGSVSYVIGPGGAGASGGSNGNGNNGGDTTFGTLNATGGNGGKNVTSGSVAGANAPLISQTNPSSTVVVVSDYVSATLGASSCNGGTCVSTGGLGPWSSYGNGTDGVQGLSSSSAQSGAIAIRY